MFWQTFLAIASKEFLQVFRNKFLVRMVATFQTLQIVMLGFIDVTVRDLPMVVVDQDQSSYSRELVEKLRATTTFDVRFLTTSVSQAREHIRAGRAKVALVIPPDFHRERARRGVGRILAMVDGSDSAASGQALAAIEGMSAQIELEIDPEAKPRDTITTHTMLMFNPTGSTSHFTLPALFAMIMANAYMGLTGMGLVRERALGTLERLLMSPIDYTGFVLGKLAPYFVMGVINASILLLIIRWVFGVPFNGSMILLGFSTIVYLLTAFGFGANIAATAANPSDVAGRASRIGVPMFFLSGYLFPLTSLPTWLRPLAYVMPVTHMIEIMRGVTLRGAGWLDLWPQVTYLCLAAFALLAIAIRRFRSSIHG